MEAQREVETLRQCLQEQAVQHGKVCLERDQLKKALGDLLAVLALMPRLQCNEQFRRCTERAQKAIAQADTPAAVNGGAVLEESKR